jgi:two-component system OmpR family response regulator
MNVEQTVQILTVDDDANIRALISDFLSEYGYRVFAAANGPEMFSLLKKQNISLIILDIMMPGEDGFTLCRRLRMESKIPIIMLTAIGEDTDRIIGLELGADDYLTKPFNMRELLARIKAILRRSQVPSTEPEKTDTGNTTSNEYSSFHFEGWQVNTVTRSLISPQNKAVALSAGEYNLLLVLVEHPHRVLSRDLLLEYTRDRSAGPFDRSIDVQISRLRQKIEADPKNPIYIKTVRGGGYIFSAKVEKKREE